MMSIFRLGPNETPLPLKKMAAVQLMLFTEAIPSTRLPTAFRNPVTSLTSLIPVCQTSDARLYDPLPFLLPVLILFITPHLICNDFTHFPLAESPESSPPFSY